MALHRIISVELAKTHRSHPESVSAVTTRCDESAEKRWTLAAVLKAMNSADRFYTQAANGRQARVQRYQCARCSSAHIRTHVSDAAIDDIFLHRARATAAS
jgi:hypothetical protein